MRGIKERLVALANTGQVHLGFRVARRRVNVNAGGKMTNDFEGVHLAIKLLLSRHPPKPPTPQCGAKRIAREKAQQSKSHQVMYGGNTMNGEGEPGGNR